MYRSIETYRGVVYPWSIDHVGHMNVASYTARFDEATWHFLGELGRKSLRFTHTMFDSSSGDVVATTELVGVYFDLVGRVSVDLPDLVREAAKKLEHDE